MARATRRRPSKGNTIEVDFTGVDIEGSGGFRIPEDDYLVEVESVEQGESKNDNPMLTWVFKGKDGKAKGKKFFFYTPLTPESLWKLGRLLDNLGFEVPDSVMEIDLTELPGAELIAVVQDDTYQGTTRSKMMDFYAVDDEKSGKKSKSKAASNGAGEEEEEEEQKPRRDRKSATTKISAEEVREMKEDELEELLEKHDLDVDLKEHRTPRRKVAAVLAALENAKLLEAE